MDIQAVADLIGKPARDVTQTDVDFVIDLIAQENVSAELMMQYDVTGDGIVDLADQNMLTDALQGGDVTLADTSMFTPATGLYQQLDQNAQVQQDMLQQQELDQQQQQELDQQQQMDMLTQLNTQTTTNQQQTNVNALMNQLRQAGDAGGQQVTTTSPEDMNIDYLYDFSSIFANPSQESLFASPYGGTLAQPANSPRGPLPRASGFAEGGQVEDENDTLLRLLGDL